MSQYFFIIEDSLTSADVYCFKPDTIVGTICKQDTTERITIPPGCSMSVLDTSLDKVSQADIIAVCLYVFHHFQIIHEVLHSQLDPEDHGIIIRVYILPKW